MRLLAYLLATLSVCASFKVLVYSPRLGRSHVNFLGKIADVLVEEGHDVTVVLPKINPLVDTNGTELAKTITTEADPRAEAHFLRPEMLAKQWSLRDPSPFELKKRLDVVRWIHTHQCEKTLNDNALLDALKSEEFDLGISEAFDYCGLGLFAEINLEKHVVVQSTILFDSVASIFGVPNVPSVVPGALSRQANDMTYFGRILNLVSNYFTQSWLDSLRDSEEAILEKKHGRRTDFYRKMAEAVFVITNSDPLLDFPRPITEKVVNLGGLNVPEPEPLDAFWEEVMNRRSKTVYMSFGSMSQSHLMPPEMKKAVLETFRRFPEVTFIWKYEIDEDEVAKDVPNVVTHKWVPQNDLLAHPNLKLFVTHSGMASVLESTHRGVPMLCIPIFGDQFRNSQMAKRFGVAQMAQKAVLVDSDVFERNIREMLENESYRKNASRLSQMMAKRPRNQREELVKHIKFAAEYGSLPEYRIPQLSFLQYYMLDIIVPAFILMAFAIYFVIKLLFKVQVVLRSIKVKTT
ncbi:hypothetical protein QR680_009803 [Steinernema hermaphroditum]|uniref:glucuronosyltransferase n=1 Tax=Steinernema hermaphroditum TaxID=289476 RepID=A0AA39IP47_9BILA|nr:hypothetical protein QR680_009803 [Steinernema hermaphroditum]